MTNRFFSPNQQFFANPVTGAPLTGGFLYFYASGTSTPQNTYSDSALSVPNANPVVLDSNGYANSIFLAASAYKVVLTDSNNVQLWTFDPVWSSDFSTYAQFQVVSGNPNGQTAGIAGTPGTLPGSSVAWDYVHQILYVCTTTGTSTTAVWTAVNPSSAAGTVLIPVPGGRLTPTSGTPVISSDVTSATSFVYTPYRTNQIPIYNGTAFTVQQFSELTMNLSSNQNASTIYDVFVFNNAGAITLVCGPAWSSSTAGSCSRGTGAGTSQLSYINGIQVNTVSMTALNGATSYTIPANQATYVGSVFIDGTAGQITCNTSWGQSRKFALWNAYWRVPITLQAGDSTASWAYQTGTIRPSNGATANSLTTFTGLAEETLNLSFAQFVEPDNLINTRVNMTIGIGYNSTTAFSGTTAKLENIFGAVSTNTDAVGSTIIASFNPAISLGINTITSLETINSTTSINTFFGTQALMLLWAQWNG
jgi:hypothetical protein